MFLESLPKNNYGKILKKRYVTNFPKESFLKNLSVVGIGSTVFGQHKCTSITGLAKKAASDAILDAGIDKGKNRGFVRWKLCLWASQWPGGFGWYFNERPGVGAIPATKVEGACASGGIAFRHACLSVAAGLTDYAIAIGVENDTSEYECGD